MEGIKETEEGKVYESNYSDIGAGAVKNILFVLAVISLGYGVIIFMINYSEPLFSEFSSIISIIGAGMLFGLGKLIELVSDIRIELYEQGEQKK